MGLLKDFFGLAYKVARLIEVQDKHNKALDRLAEQMNALDRRVTTLEHGGERVVVEAKAAASAAASAVGQAVIGDLARRLGEIGARVDMLAPAPAARAAQQPLEGPPAPLPEQPATKPRSRKRRAGS